MTGSIESVDTENGAARVRVRTADDDTVITTAITLRPGSHTLDFHADIDWHERERFLKVDLPLGIVADQATYDCQYGLVRRPIVKNTASDEAKYESSTNRFALIGDAGYAAAVINGSVYGSDATPIAGNAAEGRDSGTMFRLSLLSAPTFPDPRTDIGAHEFDWSVVANATVGSALDAACALNAPTLHDMPDLAPLASIESANGTVVLDWIKLADDGSGDLIVRAYEAAGGRADATLHVCPALAGASVHETNVLEGDDLAADLPVALQDGTERRRRHTALRPVPARHPARHALNFRLTLLPPRAMRGAEVCRIAVSPITITPIISIPIRHSKGAELSMFLLPNQQLERCDRVMQQRVKPHIHTTLAACTLRSFHNPGEPVPSSEFLAKVRNGQVPFEPFRVPGVWGTTWGTTWFEVNGHIDMAAVKGRKVELMVDLGWLDHRGPGFQSEGLVYRADGTAIKSANPRNHWIPLVYAGGSSTVELDEHGDFTVYIEAAANPFVEGPTPFSPTELGEEATGTCDFPYTLSRMDITIFNEDVFAYDMDLETVSSLICELKDDDPRYWQLAKALQRSLNIYDERDLETVPAARAALAGVLAEPAASSAINHIAIGHAHIDSAWLWPVRETRRKVARTVSNVLALMDEDPDFTYAMSSAQQYAWLEEEHPDLFARMKRRIEEGRFITVGGMWVESDNMIPSGESLVRQITFGRRYFKEHLGVTPRGIWLPDSFGYTGSWPQIARRAGFDWFLTQKISWNDTTKFPHHSFMWEGIDGTRILTHFPPSDTYCSWMSMHELMYSQRNFLDKDLSRNAILLYGFGDGGGGPTREMTARIRRDHDLAGVPKIEFGTPDQLFDRVRKDIVDDAQGETPVFKGELYLELHRATLTAQQDAEAWLPPGGVDAARR